MLSFRGLRAKYSPSHLSDTSRRSTLQRFQPTKHRCLLLTHRVNEHSSQSFNAFNQRHVVRTTSATVLPSTLSAKSTELDALLKGWVCEIFRAGCPKRAIFICWRLEIKVIILSAEPELWHHAKKQALLQPCSSVPCLWDARARNSKLSRTKRCHKYRVIWNGQPILIRYTHMYTVSYLHVHCLIAGFCNPWTLLSSIAIRVLKAWYYLPHFCKDFAVDDSAHQEYQ